MINNRTILKKTWYYIKMSKDIIVLTPNGRRQKIHCTPDTSFLQVLEDVCVKQGYQPSDYDLKHHNHIIDLTTTIRFSNVPNKAMLEMVETDRKREEGNVTVGLQLEDGERRTADFSPSTALYDLVIQLAPGEFGNLGQPTILYMRQEIVGETALRGKTLRQLGLIKGRAILRLLNKQEESRQANVSAIYRVPMSNTKVEFTAKEEFGVKNTSAESSSRNSKSPDPVTKIKQIEKEKHNTENQNTTTENEQCGSSKQQQCTSSPEMMEVDSSVSTTAAYPSHSREDLERRLKIEEEVTFLGSQKAIAFTLPDEAEAEISDLPDDFYDLSIEEVRKLYYDLQQQRIEVENTPLLPSDRRQEMAQVASQQKLELYKNVVVRVQFPDRIILQGIFTPTSTIDDVTKFIREHLRHPHKEFHIFTSPLKETLDPKMTLLEAKLVPCVLMHFKWSQEDKIKEPCLRDEIYSKITKPDAASILASKYRAPNRKKLEKSSRTAQYPSASTSKSSKAPKWFKN